MNLKDSITTVPFIGGAYAEKLKRLEINTVGDLLLHVPSRYLDLSITKKISSLQIGETSTIIGQVVSIKNSYTKTGKTIQAAQISDGENILEAIWFNQRYLANAIPEGTLISVAGKLGFWGKKKVFMSPSFEKIRGNQETLHTGRLVPIYPETAGISSKWLRSRINYCIKNISKQSEFLTKKELANIKASEFQTSFKHIHLPKNDKMIEKARRRLAFNELLKLQLENNSRKKIWDKTTSLNQIKDISSVTKFIKSLPFKLTSSQKKSIKEITTDITKPLPMNRLLTGDVGSGKTVVAAAAIQVCINNDMRSVVLAPTQILAEQHFNTLKKLLKLSSKNISLVTSATKGSLEAKVIIGTHALLNKTINLEKLALLVIDEQHRFGVKQREILANRKVVPHVLVMTATPIPRTIAITLYGDLAISTLDEIPHGRQKITTWVVPPEKRSGAYKWIGQEISKHKSQAFIVCPLIEESDKDTMKQVRAATQEIDKIKKILPKLKIELLHGRIKSNGKSSILKKFKGGIIDILVSTPVVEVGIDIPNATIMMIETADRFGLSQLHQLRGRVGRGEKKSYCLLFTENESEKTINRLEALKKAKSGKELAEHDLAIRGPGEVFGTKQHGFHELKIARWTDIELIKYSKKFATSHPERSRRILLV